MMASAVFLKLHRQAGEVAPHHVEGVVGRCVLDAHAAPLVLVQRAVECAVRRGEGHKERADGVHTVGTLFVALATPDGTFHRTLHKDKWGRVRIKHAAANHAFDMVRRYLTGLPVEFEENR